MTAKTHAPATTSIATSDATSITVRGHDLCRELIGHVSFTDMIWLDILGVRPTAGQRAVLDACLVTLVEHGLTPSVLASRLVYGSAPEALQGGVAAGLLGVGSRLVGASEDCAALLARIANASDPSAEAATIVAEHAAAKAALPGFGHDVHMPDDPRPARLFEVARAHGVAGRQVAALEALARALDAAKRRHITINATGAIAAVLADAGMPPQILRGIAVIARCAGLVGHLLEEQRTPTMSAIWHAAEEAVPYSPDPKT